MKEELLQELKKEIKNKKIEILYKKACNETAKSLENNLYVKEYLKLCGIKSAVNNNIEEFNLLEEFNKFKERINPDETNKIFNYCGTYLDGTQEIRLYHDLEQKGMRQVPTEDAEKFEKENIIINTEYSKATLEFIRDVLNHSQEEAVTNIKKKYIK